jgi:integrase
MAGRRTPRHHRPGHLDRQTCASWIAALDRMRVGDFVERTAGLTNRLGQPLTAGSKAGQIAGLRTFFRDCQEWEWLPRRFDPPRALATPRSITAMVGPNPRVIADDVWAKLLWAGLNLTADDLPPSKAGPFYPIELVRAVTVTWLFAGQRSDEIVRLRVGCIRWQYDGTPVPGNAGDVLARDAVCLLDVPTHKTGTAFTKPVDPILGQAVDAWQTLRPAQPPLIDRRTGESVDLLFAARARSISTAYINNTIIPMLCRKAGVPTVDVRGAITSHRARSTIASQLYNAKEPMTLFELQAWLGHRSPQSTQFYAKISPNTLTRAYRDAGYFARNVRTIEVLVDRDAVASGAAATGQPWQHYDLGHGYCSYTFFEQCPTGWPALAVTSTLRRRPAPASLSRPSTTCNACWSTFPSPTTSAPPSKTARPPSRNFSAVSPTWPPPPDRHHANSAPSPAHRCPSPSSPHRESRHHKQMRPHLFTIDQPGPGTLSTMAKPRGGDWLADEMTALRVAGVDILTSALTAAELHELDLIHEPQAARDAGLQFISMPITDRGTPDPAVVLPHLRRLAERLRAGDHIVTHCRFGIGRASLLAASILVLNGLPPDQAWTRLEHARGLAVPDTPAQRAWPDALLRLPYIDDH